MVEMELIELLRQLEMMIEEAPAKAFSHKIVVDREEILSLIKEIKSVIPEEVKQASWINTERVKIISDEEIVLQGEKEVERLLKENQKNIEALDKDYQAKIEYMIENNQVVQRANERAEAIKDKAEKYKYEMIESSNQYAEDVLSFLEQKLEETLEEVKNNKRELNPRI